MFVHCFLLLQLVTQWTLIDGVNRQFEAFREGFESMFPLSTLRLFYADEVARCLCHMLSVGCGTIIQEKFHLQNYSRLFTMFTDQVDFGHISVTFQYNVNP